jgi:spermidine synthase
MDHGNRRLALLLFLASGTTGLVYEIVWTRLLREIIGSSTGAASAAVCAYMTGLALGSLLLGRLGDRFRSPLAGYGVLELATAAAAALATLALGRAAGPLSALVGASESAAAFLARYGIALGILILPTSLMGATLPALSRLFVTGAGGAGAGLGGLMAVNTAGAAAGSVLAGFILPPLVGSSALLLATASVNGLIGCAALLAGRAGPAPGGPRAAAEAGAAPVDAGPAPPPPFGAGRAALMAGLAVSGFTSFGYEILWTRALSVPFGNSTYAFATLLTAFLSGVGLGNAAVRAAAPRIRDPRRLFALTQACIGAAAALSLALLLTVFATSSVQGALGGGTHWLAVLFLRFGGALAVMLVPAFLIGTTFPLAGMACVRDPSRTSGDVGALSAANAAGNAVGALAPSLLLIPLVGVTKAVLVLCCVNLGLGSWFLLAAGRRPAARWAAAAATLALAAAAALLPPFFRFPSDTESPGDRMLYYREGVSATTAVYEKPETGQKHMSVDGISIGGTGGTEQKEQLLAHLPKLFLSGSIAECTVGLGSGILAGESALHACVERLVCVEIADTVAAGAACFSRENHGVLSSPKARVVVADGVQYLRGSRERFTIISTDAKSRPTAQGNGTFFSRDYFELTRGHLTDDGVAVQWIPLHFPLSTLKSALRAFVEVFPHAYLWWFSDADLVLVGSLRPLRPEAAAEDRLLSTVGDAFDGLRAYGVDSAAALWGGFVAGRDALEAATRGAVVNTLDRPVIEFYPFRDYARPVNAIVTENLGFVLALSASAPPAEVLAAFPGPARARLKRSRAAAVLCARALSMAYGLSSDEPGMERLLGQAIAAAPADNRVRYTVYKYFLVRALRRIQVGRPAEAIPYLDAARGAYPRGADAWYLASVALEATGDASAALASLWRAVELDPGSMPFRQSLVMALSRAGALDEAGTELRAMEAADPGNLFALTNLGLYLAEKRGDFAGALPYLRRALEASPADPALTGYLAWYTYRAGDVTGAARIVRAAGGYARGDAAREEQRRLILEAARGG